jgi:hypothetical protein
MQSLHNLNIRLIEHKNFLWNCTGYNDPYDIADEIASQRIASGIVKECALVMEENLWLKWISVETVKSSFRLNVQAESAARGVMGVWYAAHSQDEVIVLSDANVHVQDRIISHSSYTFVHISQVKYPRQYDAPVRRV